MKFLVCLMSGAALAMVSIAGIAVAQQSPTPMPLSSISSTGNFLAGERAYFDLHMDEAAAYFYAAAQADWDNPVVLERTFLALAADGQVSRAASMAQRILDLHPEADLARLIVATEALKQRRYAAAADVLDTARGDNLLGNTGLILRSWALLGDGQGDAALDKTSAVAEDTLSDYVTFNKALMAELAGKTDQALAFAKAAYDKDPTAERVAEAYARILGNVGKFDEAIKVTEEFAAAGSTHPLMDAVAAELKAGKAPGLMAANAQTGAAEMFQGIAMSLARDSSSDLAVIFFRLGLYLNPKADSMSLALGQLFDRSGQTDTANAIYDAIPTNSPLKLVADVRVASNLNAKGDRAEALRRLGNIVAAHPDSADAVSVYGDMLRADKQFVAAADAYTKLLAIDGGERPADWRYYYVRGMTFERSNDWSKAEADFEKALALNPDQPQVLNYLGYSWVDQGVKLDKALEMIQKAVAASPNDGYIVDSLGWAFYKLGRYEDAVQVLEQAVQMEPNDPEINDHLGDAYWHAGRKLEAGFQWNIASSVDKEGNVKARIKSKYAQGPAPISTVE